MGMLPDTWAAAEANAKLPRKPLTTKRKATSTPEPAARVPFWDDPAAYEQFSPVELWSPWDTATIGGLRVPGLVRVRSRKHRKLFVAGSIGAEAEQTTDTGAEAANIEITCAMWMPVHLVQYSELAALIRLRGGTRKNPKAMRIDHPGLALLGIKELYLTSVGVPEPKGSGSVYTATIEAQEFDPTAKPKKGSTKGSVLPVAPGFEPKSAYEGKLGPTSPSTDSSQAKP